MILRYLMVFVRVHYLVLLCFEFILMNLYTPGSQLNMGATLVSVSFVYLHMLTTWRYWRLVQMQQETCSQYAMNSVNDIRLSSML